MLRFICIALMAACLSVLPLFTAAQSGGTERAGMLLALAVDSSDSVTFERWRVQMRGYARAFRSEEVLGAIEKMGSQGIAVALYAFSGPGEQQVLVSWFRVYDRPSARAFAHMAEEASRPFKGLTYIGDGLDFGIKLLAAAPFSAQRNVIDISGDGKARDSPHPNTPSDMPLAEVRRAAVDRGIVINGLPILGEEFVLDQYYRDNVVTPDGFIEVVKDAADENSFTQAIIKKLLREIVA